MTLLHVVSLGIHCVNVSVYMTAASSSARCCAIDIIACGGGEKRANGRRGGDGEGGNMRPSVMA